MDMMLDTRGSLNGDEKFEAFLEDMQEDESDDDMVQTSDEESSSEMLTDTEINKFSFDEYNSTKTDKKLKDKSTKRSKRGTSKRLKAKPIYECGVCVKRYRASYELREHMATHSDERPYECPTCGKGFKKKKVLRQHQCPKNPDINNGIYKCSVCEVQFRYRISLEHHMKKHQGFRYSCTICNKTYGHKYSLQLHMKLHKPTDGNTVKYIACEICQKLLTSEANLTIHMKSHTGTQQFECETCHASFGRPWDLKRHVYIHTGEKPHKCALCPSAFRHPGDLGRHMAWHRGDHTCKYCQRKYQRRDELLRHINKHEEQLQIETEADTSLQCKYCGVFLSCERTLKMHMEAHERKAGSSDNPLQFTCKLCNKDYKTRSNLYKHIRNVHDMNMGTYHIHDADSVEKRSDTMSDGVDEVKDNHNTSVAVDSVITDTNLNQTQKPSICCHVCGKTFASKPTLRRHLKTLHQITAQGDQTSLINVNKFECDLCSKRLKSKETLRDHINYVHLQKFNISCDICDRKFYKRKDLKRHVDKHHATT